MENSLICLDTSILIDFYRKKDKSKSSLFKLTERHVLFAVSSITEYELYLGSSDEQNIFWDKFFSQITILPFNTKSAKLSAKIYQQLKSKNKLIDTPDILITGTAMSNNLPLATLNRKHFERIKDLKLVDLE
jgi:predicted nucleic acid-binding protein